MIIADHAGRNDFSDEQSVRDLWWKISAGQVVLDVGSAIGSYTLPALEAGAHVISFCPGENLAPILRRNVEANEGFSSRCDILEHGAFSKTGWLTCNNSWDRYLFSEHKVSGASFPVMPIDSMNLQKVDWIKIDVEGHEVEVLQGAEQTIRRCRPKLLIENHLFIDYSMEIRTEEFMRNLGLGYEVETHPYHAVSHSLFEVR